MIILVLIAASLAHPYVVYAQPSLSLEVTHDVKLLCNMDGFSGHIDWLGSLQIAKRHGFEDGKYAVLVTVAENVNHTSKTLDSDFLKELYPMYHVAGEINSRRPYQSWLSLTLINMNEDMNGEYVCWINYMEHPADIEQMTWTAELTVNASRQETVERKGFSAAPGRGVSASCDAGLYSHSPISSITIESEDGKMSASWSNDTGYVTQSLVSPLFRPQEGKLQACLLTVPCADVSKYKCKVTRTRRSLSESSRESLPSKGCSGPTVPETNDTKTDETVSSLSANAVIAIAISVCLTVVGVVVVVLVVLWKKRDKLSPKLFPKKLLNQKAENKNIDVIDYEAVDIDLREKEENV